MVNNRCLALVRQYKSYSNAEKVCRFNGGAVMGLAKNAVVSARDDWKDVVVRI